MRIMRDRLAAAVKFVAGQVEVDPAMFAGYAWSGRTAGYHRAQLRAVLGFREPVVSDEDKLADCLAAEVCRAEPGPAATGPVPPGEDRAAGAEPDRADRGYGGSFGRGSVHRPGPPRCWHPVLSPGWRS